MSNSVTPPRRTKGASMTAQDHGSPESPPDPFKLRAEIQVLAKDMGPLFSTFTKKLGEEGQAEGLAEAVVSTNHLAFAIARKFTRSNNPRTGEVRPFRSTAAALVADAWKVGELKSLDIEYIAEQTASALFLVQTEMDRNLFKDQTTTQDASIAMTMANVTASLFRPVLTYDFRLDHHELVASMGKAVVEQVIKAAKENLPPGSTPDDERNLQQTYANQLSAIMTAIYERKARQFVIQSNRLPPEEREAVARKYDPVPDILSAFKRESEVYVNICTKLAKSLNPYSHQIPENHDVLSPKEEASEEIVKKL